ncbi:MAG: hypothetical protein ACFWT7_07280 [Succiniclasticum sp.]
MGQGKFKDKKRFSTEWFKDRKLLKKGKHFIDKGSVLW